MTYIVELIAENVKRLRLVELQLDKGVVTIGGRNAQGKTSLLDAIAMAIGGQELIPPEPVRRGANGGRVQVTLDDGLVAERIFGTGGKSTLKVRSSEGFPVKSPQALLDKLFGKISFDPLAFMRLDAKKQLEELRKISGVDTATLDGQRAKAYDERTEVSREVKRLEGALAKMPPLPPGAPTEAVSVEGLAKELESRRQTNAKYAAKQREIDNIRDRKARAEAEIVKAKEALAQAETALVAIKSEGKAATTELQAMPEANEQEVIAKISDIEAVNERARASASRKAAMAELEAKREEALALTAAIQRIDDEKRKLLASSKLPVPGLVFDDSGVRYDNVPLEQASAAQQIRISAAIGLALNPKLKVLRIYDGSLLDSDSMQALRDLAFANEAQIIIERVGDGDATVSIEDGMVAGASSANEEKPQAQRAKSARERQPGEDG